MSRQPGAVGREPSAGSRAGRRRPSSGWGRRCRRTAPAASGVADAAPSPARRRRAGPRSGRPFSSTSSRPGATPLAASTASGRLPTGPAPGRPAASRRASSGGPCGATARVDLARRTSPASTTRLARALVAVDEELAGAEPPEVVHGHHDPGPGERGRRAAARRRATAGRGGARCRAAASSTWAAEALGDRRVVQLRSSDQPIHGERHHPAHRHAGLVGVGPRYSSGGRSPSQPAKTLTSWPRARRPWADALGLQACPR